MSERREDVASTDVVVDGFLAAEKIMEKKSENGTKTHNSKCQVRKCASCGQTGHLRRTHKSCPMYVPRKKRAGK